MAGNSSARVFAVEWVAAQPRMGAFPAGFETKNTGFHADPVTDGWHDGLGIASRIYRFDETCMGRKWIVPMGFGSNYFTREYYHH